MPSKHTPERIRKNVAMRLAALETAAPDSNVAKAFRALVAAWDKADPNASVTFEMPCGSKVKIVCLHDARERAERAGKVNHG